MEDDMEITAKASRASEAVIASLMHHEPITLVMDLLDAHGFDFIIGVRTPAKSTLTVTSRGARDKMKGKQLRGHVRQALKVDA